MNKSVCQLCRRFSNLLENKREDVWYCATVLHTKPSEVIPGHSVIIKDSLRPITSAMVKPPSWCERILEQTILSPEEKVELEQDAKIVYDGNKEAELYVKERQVNPYAVWNGSRISEPW